ncbi:MAG: hypothetical protein VX910_08550 [Candidatus Latescibacterota bacterium]|nr:hypothetical protein [Candidatus Latescibacterota bacterium]
MTALLLLLTMSLTNASAQTRGTLLQAHTAVDTIRFGVGPKLFPKTEIDSLIKANVHVDSLAVFPSLIRITEGGSYDLKNLYVIAIDSKGGRVTKAPLELELNAFNSTLGTERIMGFRRGTAQMRITSILPRHDKKSRTNVEITVVVAPWPN